MLGQQVENTAIVPGLSQAEAGLLPVLCFFLISGFVIAWTVDRSETSVDFVVSRFSRLYPAFWASIGVTVGLTVCWPLPGADLTVSQVLVNLTMAQEFMGVRSVDGVFWSLTVELTFYIWVLAVLVCGWWRYMHLAVFAWACAGLFDAVAETWGLHMPWRVEQLLLLQWSPFLASGVMLYRLWQRQHVTWSSITLVVCMLTVAAKLRPVPAVICYVAIAVIAGASRGGMRWLSAPALVWLGTISYTLYLSHQTVSFTIIRTLDASGARHTTSIIIAVISSLVLASALSFGVERPALRVIRRAYSKAKLGAL